MIKITDVLRENGLKVTPQRMAVYTALAATTSHPSAEAIYKALIPDNPTISLATVYKTLDSFKTAGLIQELSIVSGRSNYDANTMPHPHIMCTHCNQIFDFQMDDLSTLRSAVTKATNFLVKHEQLVFYGICPSCQSN